MIGNGKNLSTCKARLQQGSSNQSFDSCSYRQSIPVRKMVLSFVAKVSVIISTQSLRIIRELNVSIKCCWGELGIRKGKKRGGGIQQTINLAAF